MNSSAQTIFLVDDDAAFVKSTTRLLRAAGFEVRAFSSSEAFLRDHDIDLPGCLLLDVAMPGVHGLELQRKLTSIGSMRPIVFATGQGDVSTSVQAMKAGAVHFLTKPFGKAELLAAIGEALQKDSLGRGALAERQVIERRLASLTPREREVLSHVIAGRLNKQIAGDLCAAEKTVKVHRGQVMEKMGARSVADLVRMSARIDFSPFETPLRR